MHQLMLVGASPSQVAAQVVAAILPPPKQQLLKVGVCAENQALMRATCTKYITHHLPIPILTPAGIKLPPHELDFCEVKALEVFHDLQQRVSAVYPPGIHVILRLEDCTLSQVVPNGLAMMSHFARYANTMRQVVSTLGYSKWLTVKQESTLMSRDQFYTLLDSLVPHFLNYILHDVPDAKIALDGKPITPQLAHDGLTTLQGHGWLGPIPQEARQFFRDNYAKRYPEWSPLQREELIARYFACTLVRRLLKGVGDFDEPNWRFGETHVRFASLDSPSFLVFSGRLELAMMQPVPGSAQFERQRVWYRSQLDGVNRHSFWRMVSQAHPKCSTVSSINVERETAEDTKMWLNRPRMMIQLSSTIKIPVYFVCKDLPTPP